jgi:hypothetical protein
MKSPKRDAVIRAMTASPALSAAEIAHQIGCAYSYASMVIKEESRSGEKILLLARAPVGKPKVVRTRAAAAQRRAHLRTMVAEGYNPAQIAEALGITREYVGVLLHREGLATPRKGSMTRVHNAVRIVEHIVMDAEELTSDVKLIDFSTLPAARVPAWLASLDLASINLRSFIRQLRRLAYEATRCESDGPETPDAAPLESAAGPVEDDAGAPGGTDAA